MGIHSSLIQECSYQSSLSSSVIVLNVRLEQHLDARVQLSVWRDGTAILWLKRRSNHIQLGTQMGEEVQLIVCHLRLLDFWLRGWDENGI